VFCTSDTILQSALKAVGIAEVSSIKVNAGFLIRIDAVTGKVIGTWEFNTYSAILDPYYGGYFGENDEYLPYGNKGYEDETKDTLTYLDEYNAKGRGRRKFKR
jgi:hypothetical protein